MGNISFEDFKFISDDEMSSAFPFGPVGGAAPAVSIGPGLQVFVESEIVET